MNKPIGMRRYDWNTSGMVESDDGNYLLATNIRLAAPQLLEACKHALIIISGMMDEQSESAVERELKSAIAAAEKGA